MKLNKILLTLEPSMVDKICKMKQLKKKKEGTTPKKNRPSYCTKSMALPKQPLKSSEKKISRKNKMQQRELNTKGCFNTKFYITIINGETVQLKIVKHPLIRQKSFS